MNTMPLELSTPGAAPEVLEEFRIAVPCEVAAFLDELRDGAVLLHLGADDGMRTAATLHAVDFESNTIAFEIDARDPALTPLLERPEMVAVGKIRNVKLLFYVRHAELVLGPRGGSVLNASYPHEIFRFQRRGAFRVHPPLRHSPIARLRHPLNARLQLALRVADLSIGGCALLLPDDMPALPPGSVLNRVELQLDADTLLHTDLRLQHVTPSSANGQGVRLGCEFVRPDAAALRTLQLFIDHFQKRSRLLAVGGTT